VKNIINQLKNRTNCGYGAASVPGCGYGIASVTDPVFNLIEKIRAWLASNFLNDVLIDCFQVV